MNRRLFLLASLALGGCTTVAVAPPARPTAPAPLAAPPPPAPPPAEPPPPLAELEPLYSARATRVGLTIEVNSNGCTARSDFTFYVQRRAGTAAVAFARKHVDVCRSPARAELVFTWTELGLEPGAEVFLLNPIMDARAAIGRGSTAPPGRP